MLSLIELQNKKIESKRKKYDQAEMDQYLELVFDNYKEMLDENKKLQAEISDLNKKIKTLSDGVQYYRSIETTLQKALILAEKTSKETKDAAILKAESIEREAHKRADILIQRAEDDYNKIRAKSLNLIQEFNQYKSQLVDAANAQLQLLAGDQFAVSSPASLDVAVQKTMADTPAKSVPNNTVKESETPVESETVEETELPLKTETVEESETPAISKTVEEPEIESESSQTDSVEMTKTEEDILNADTIDLSDTLDSVKNEVADTKAEMDHDAVKEDKTPEKKDVQPKKTEPVKRTPQNKPSNKKTKHRSPQKNDTKTAEVKDATILEPVEAKTVAPMDVVFEDELAASKEEEKMQAPSDKEGAVPTLDSLLQDLNLNNMKNKKSDDPFEFLGSVDDF